MLGRGGCEGGRIRRRRRRPVHIRERHALSRVTRSAGRPAGVLIRGGKNRRRRRSAEIRGRITRAPFSFKMYYVYAGRAHTPTQRVWYLYTANIAWCARAGCTGCRQCDRLSYCGYIYRAAGTVGRRRRQRRRLTAIPFEEKKKSRKYKDKRGTPGGARAPRPLFELLFWKRAPKTRLGFFDLTTRRHPWFDSTGLDRLRNSDLSSRPRTQRKGRGGGLETENGLTNNHVHSYVRINWTKRPRLIRRVIMTFSFRVATIQ